MEPDLRVAPRNIWLEKNNNGQVDYIKEDPSEHLKEIDEVLEELEEEREKATSRASNYQSFIREFAEIETIDGEIKFDLNQRSFPNSTILENASKYLDDEWHNRFQRNLDDGLNILRLRDVFQTMYAEEVIPRVSRAQRISDIRETIADIRETAERSVNSFRLPRRRDIPEFEDNESLRRYANQMYEIRSDVEETIIDYQEMINDGESDSHHNFLDSEGYPVLFSLAELGSIAHTENRVAAKEFLYSNEMMDYIENCVTDPLSQASSD